MRFEVSQVLDAMERRLGTDPALAACVVDVAEMMYCADLDGGQGRPANLLRLGLVIDALSRHLGEEQVSVYCVVDKSLLSNQDLTSNERMVMRRWADDGIVEVVVGAAQRVVEIGQLAGLPVISRTLPATWAPVAGTGGATLNQRGTAPQSPSELGQRLTGRWWRCPDPECAAFGPARRTSGQPVPRMKQIPGNAVPVCPRHDAPLADVGARPPHQVMSVRIDGLIRTRFVVTAAAPVVVGRAPENGQGVVLGQWLSEEGRAKVSRAHISLTLTQQGMTVTDTSMNGTMVRLGGAGEGELPLTKGAQRTLGQSDVVELFPGVEIARVGVLTANRSMAAPSAMGEAPTMIFRPTTP